MSRRESMKLLGIGSATGLMGLAGFGSNAMGQERDTPSYARATSKVTIRSVKAIATAPQGPNLVVVKVETSEPGL